MRLATTSGFERVTQRLNGLQTEADALLAQIATGKRFASPADAPASAAQVSAIGYRLAEHAQILRNIDTAVIRLTLGDGALQEAGVALDRAREVALAAASDTANPADRVSAAAELAQLSGQLLAAANRREANGDWLFSGALTQQSAYSRGASGVVSWQGSGLPPDVPIGDGRTVVAAEPGSMIFDNVPTTNGQTTAFAAIDELRAALVDPTLDGTARRTIVNQSLLGLEISTDRIGNTRARFGARLAALDTERTSLGASAIELTATRGRLEDTDITAAAVSLSRAQLLLQATRDAFARIGSISLFDSLR